MRASFLLAVILALLLGTATPASPEVADDVRVVADLPARAYGPAVWAADGRRLLYLDKAPDWGPAMLLDLADPANPRQITVEKAGDVAWSPDHKRIAYTSPRRGDQWTVETIRVKPIGRATAGTDTLPGALAERSVSTAKQIHGWFEEHVLAYHEHMGTSVQQLILLDPAARTTWTSEELMATEFVWDEAGRRVAGQISGGPAHFWLWDRQQRRFLLPDRPLPGAYQWFESWSSDGQSVLFTAWESSGWYGEPGARSTLYRLDIDTGEITKVADQAGLATWSGDLIAYVKLEIRLTLVVAHQDGRVRWTADLGDLAKIDERLPWGYRPKIAVSFIGYRTADDEWRVSPVQRKESRLLFRGPATSAAWSPFGRYLAVHRPVGEGVRLQVLENPLTPGRPVPIEEAVRVATEAVRARWPEAELLRGFSQQTYEEREAYPPAGLDGTRRAWAFEFVDPETDTLVIVGTWDGEVTGTEAAGTDTSRGCDPTRFRIKFDVRYDDGRCVVSVGGMDEQGRSKRLMVNPVTREVLSAG